MRCKDCRRSRACFARAFEIRSKAYLVGALLLAALLLPAGVAIGRSGRAAPGQIIGPYDKGGAFWQGDLWSPDGRYIASARSGEAAVLTVTIVDAKSRRRLVRAEDVDGFVWVPRHPHRLVVATCGLYGKASLVMWDRGTHWRSLHRVRRPDSECFELYGVTDDGRQIVYGYEPDLEAAHRAGVNRLEQRRWLSLPRR